MPTLGISNACWGFTVARNGTDAVGGFFTSTSTNVNLLSGSTSGSACLIIYTGTVPTFAALTDRAARAADVLITFLLPAGLTANTDLGIVSGARRYLVGRHPANQAASATGVATWFLMGRTSITSTTTNAALIGTVGLPGSGADLEIPNVNIYAGTNYQSAGIFLNFPHVQSV